MAKYRNWDESPATVDLLRYFGSTRDPQAVIESSRYRYTNYVDPQKMIRYFVNEGLLIPPSVSTALGVLYTRPPLEEKLKELGLSIKGTKAQLIERLVSNNQLIAERMVEGHKLLTCSDTATSFLDAYENKKLQAEKEAKQASFIALTEKDDQKAHRIFADHMVLFYLDNELTEDAREYFSVDIDLLQYVLKGEPSVIRQLTNEHKNILRAACCMPILWYYDREISLRWLPEEVQDQFSDPSIAINLCTQYAKIMKQLASYRASTGKRKSISNQAQRGRPV